VVVVVGVFFFSQSLYRMEDQNIDCSPCRAMEEQDENGQTYVRTVGGRMNRVDVPVDATVGALRLSTAKALGLNASDIRLVTNGKELVDDAAPLAAAGVKTKRLVHALLRLDRAPLAQQHR
jgi:hypothetical protein